MKQSKLILMIWICGNQWYNPLQVIHGDLAGANTTHGKNSEQFFVMVVDRFTRKHYVRLIKMKRVKESNIVNIYSWLWEYTVRV